jgi:predicted RNA binding protein YcfA (HicA-like mRNA interferase family)
MAIDYSRLRSLRARRLIRALKKDGFYEERSKGSLRLFKHPNGRRTTIHLHNMGQTFAIGTLKAIIEQQAQWTEADLKRLGLL